MALHSKSQAGSAVIRCLIASIIISGICSMPIPNFEISNPSSDPEIDYPFLERQYGFKPQQMMDYITKCKPGPSPEPLMSITKGQEIGQKYFFRAQQWKAAVREVTEDYTVQGSDHLTDSQQEMNRWPYGPNGENYNTAGNGLTEVICNNKGRQWNSQILENFLLDPAICESIVKGVSSPGHHIYHLNTDESGEYQLNPDEFTRTVYLELIVRPGALHYGADVMEAWCAKAIKAIFGNCKTENETVKGGSAVVDLAAGRSSVPVSQNKTSDGFSPRRSSHGQNMIKDLDSLLTEPLEDEDEEVGDGFAIIVDPVPSSDHNI